MSKTAANLEKNNIWPKSKAEKNTNKRIFRFFYIGQCNFYSKIFIPSEKTLSLRANM